MACQWKILLSQEKENYEKKVKSLNILDICEYFASTSQLNNNISIPICMFWSSQAFFIPIRTEVGFVNLFLFTGKITIGWTLMQAQILPYATPSIG